MTLNKLDKNMILKRAENWLSSDYDEQTQQEVKKLIADDSAELINSFYCDLIFGTGGLRGIMGVGTNRMNIYTVGKVTQGVIHYLLEKHPNQQLKIAITYDSRHNSQLFAKAIANICTANNIIAYLSKELRPTPWLSFCVRDLKCQAGIVVTASHNPPKYNGYKVYNSDGGQIIFPEDQKIITEVTKISSPKEILKKAKEDLLFLLGEQQDFKYLNYLQTLSLYSIQRNINQIAKNKKQIKTIYTPIHGTGITLLPQALKAFKIDNLSIVTEQATPNGDFPTVSYPNPEEKKVLKLGLAQMEKEKAELLLATDPDSDRVGVVIRDEQNNPYLLNGNQTAILLFDYLFTLFKQQNRLNNNVFCSTTIVTTPLLHQIAQHFGVKIYTVLTGFKYIAEVIKQKENQEQFLIGAEESYGYLIGDQVRDKDAIGASALIVEMCQYDYDQGSTSFQRLLEIYIQHGIRQEDLLSITKEGKNGQEEINAIMKRFRENPPKQINESKVVVIKDYLQQEIKKIDQDSSTEPTHLPTSNVLQFELEDQSLISIRPSGTEPKIKFYVSVYDILASKKDYLNTYQKLVQKCKIILTEISKC